MSNGASYVPESCAALRHCQYSQFLTEAPSLVTVLMRYDPQADLVPNDGSQQLIEPHETYPHFLTSVFNFIRAVCCGATQPRPSSPGPGPPQASSHAPVPYIAGLPISQAIQPSATHITALPPAMASSLPTASRSRTSQVTEQAYTSTLQGAHHFRIDGSNFAHAGRDMHTVNYYNGIPSEFLISTSWGSILITTLQLWIDWSCSYHSMPSTTHRPKIQNVGAIPALAKPF